MPRILTLAALLLLAAASLTAAGDVDPDSFLRTAPYELIIGADADRWCEAGDDAFVEDEPADLRGAHFALSLSCLFQEPSIPGRLVGVAPELANVPPAEPGTEFLIVRVAHRAQYFPEDEASPHTTSSWIMVEDRRLYVGAVPAEGKFLVLSVPIGAETVLWVEDSERAQGLDLRTGGQVDPVTAYYNGLALRSFDFGGFEGESLRIVNDRRGGTATCSTEYAEGTRAVWLEEHGWAPEGTVFMVVRTRWCSRYNDITWDLDQERAFTIDGEAPVSWKATERNKYWDDLVLVFSIPADAREATIDFSPVGDIRFKETGEELFGDGLPNFSWKAAF